VGERRKTGWLTCGSFRGGDSLAPRRLERLAGIGDGRIDILWRGMRKVELLLAGGRVDGGERLAIGGRLPLVVAVRELARIATQKGKTYMNRPVGTVVSRPEGSVTVWCTLDMVDENLKVGWMKRWG
jgi:hypothetical protein